MHVLFLTGTLSLSFGELGLDDVARSLLGSRARGDVSPRRRGCLHSQQNQPMAYRLESDPPPGGQRDWPNRRFH
ncbi:hypothetical protein C8Q69DRAFT_83868 [Paecilomyces variotii]|uniref:Secreted protein n=1 Tax=Byssochlamys spectabilis TaxID=264951 RepID=A0A443HLB0_BYSSP|nr:hypothetical protein C8Q69DRAFT_83868 [Paecilomyces variotii]RWQ92609.1 hypothetical protein C8Q69DRAFT_83868 [Paecilomyces variotii]